MEILLNAPCKVTKSLGPKTFCFEFFHGPRSIKSAKWDLNTLILECSISSELMSDETVIKRKITFPEEYIFMTEFKADFLAKIEEYGNLRFWEEPSIDWEGIFHTQKDVPT